jgi:hypothetical protein
MSEERGKIENLTLPLVRRSTFGGEHAAQAVAEIAFGDAAARELMGNLEIRGLRPRSLQPQRTGRDRAQ